MKKVYYSLNWLYILIIGWGIVILFSWRFGSALSNATDNYKKNSPEYLCEQKGGIPTETESFFGGVHMSNCIFK